MFLLFKWTSVIIDYGYFKGWSIKLLRKLNVDFRIWINLLHGDPLRRHRVPQRYLRFWIN